MADSQNPPTNPGVWWHQLLGAAVAALTPVLVKGITAAFSGLEKQLAPWDGQTERRQAAPPAPPAASGTP